MFSFKEKAILKYLDPVYQYRLRQKREAIRKIEADMLALNGRNDWHLFFMFPMLQARRFNISCQAAHGLFFNRKPKGRVIEINRGSGTYKDFDVKIEGNKVHVQNNKNSTNIKVKMNFEEVEND